VSAYPAAELLERWIQRVSSQVLADKPAPVLATQSAAINLAADPGGPGPAAR